MHDLQAIVAAADVLGPFVAGRVHAHRVALPAGFALVPVTDELRAEVSGPGGDHPGFVRLSTALADALSDLSAGGPVAYVESEAFGGGGDASAVVWEARRRVLGPLVCPDVHLSGARPVEDALAAIGVTLRPGADDLFDTLDLGRHRSTEDWVAAAAR